MSLRSYSDVPNRIINLFLQEAGDQYDRARSLNPYRRMTPELLARFDGACAYCGALWEVEDHLVPRNRDAGGLHSWGNVVPACRPCNRSKSAKGWQEYLDSLELISDAREETRLRIRNYIDEFAYDPDMDTLLPVLTALYTIADEQARALVRFALTATGPHLTAMRRPTPKAVAATR